MVERYQMAVIGEQSRILGILSADRQAKHLAQIAVVRVDLEDHYGVVAGIGADEVLKVGREIERARRRSLRVIVVERGNGLDLLKIGCAVHFMVEIDVNDILQLMDDIQEVAVLGELEVPRRRFKFRVKDAALLDVSVLSVERVHIDMIHTQICSQKEMVVSCHLDTLHMRAEIALCNTSEAL